MSKFVAKFRKDRDYNDDYDYSQRKKRSGKHDPVKKLTNYDYDMLMQDEQYQTGKNSKRKAKHFG